MSDLVPRLKQVRQSIPSHVTLVIASKTQSVESIRTLYDQGERDFGENYVQELVTKAQALTSVCPEIRWHMIGHLQTNKVKSLIPWVNVVHTVDSQKLASELAKRWKESGRGDRLSIYIEVNIDEEPTKAGVPPSETVELAKTIDPLKELQLLGLMCIPSHAHPVLDSGETSSFLRLRDLESLCQPMTQGQLSMGMSQDYLQAIQQGSTCVRVGTAIFGERIPKSV